MVRSAEIAAVSGTVRVAAAPTSRTGMPGGHHLRVAGEFPGVSPQLRDGCVVPRSMLDG